MKILQILFIISILTTCEMDFWIPDPYKDAPYACSKKGKCETFYQIDPLVQPGVYQDDNDYWHIEYMGFRYFTIEGHLSTLDPYYVINGVPLIEVTYDSDYWLVFDTMSFKVPIYSVLSWFTNGDFNNLLPIGNLTYTMVGMAVLHPPINIAGYQINKSMCWDCPYSKTLIGSYSKYNYNPRQQFIFNETMKGDTLQIRIETLFNSDVGKHQVIEDVFNIVVDER